MIFINEPFTRGLAQGVTNWLRYRRGSMAPYLALLLCVPLLGALCSYAQNSKPTAVTPQVPKAAPPSDFKVPLLNEPLRLSDFAGMEPRPELKGQLAKVTGFIQNSPNDGE